MSDMTAGMGDQYIDLDLGGIEAIHGFIPVPTAVYVLQITDASVTPTQKGGRQIEKRDRIAEGPMEGRSVGIDRIFIPDRDSQDPKAYETTAGYFKGKLEAITGRPYAGRLSVRELVGMKYKAIVQLVDEGYGPQNKITAYLPMSADTAGIVLPQATATRPRAAGGRDNGGGGQQEVRAGGFKI